MILIYSTSLTSSTPDNLLSTPQPDLIFGKVQARLLSQRVTENSLKERSEFVQSVLDPFRNCLNIKAFITNIGIMAEVERSRIRSVVQVRLRVRITDR